MSFIIANKKSRNQGTPIAIIKGGEDNGKYVFMKEKKYKISDLPKSFLSRLNADAINVLEYALETGIEPNEPYTELYYEALEVFEKQRLRGFILKSGKLLPLPNFNKHECLYITGASGSGKSYFSSNFIREYLKHYKNEDNDFVLVSGVDEDEVLDKLEPNRISPEELVEKPLEASEVTDNIILFDDVLSHPNRLVKMTAIGTINHLIEVGRHTRSKILVISHLINNGHESRKIINESTSLTFFPKTSAKHNIRTYLERYEGLPKVIIRKIMNLPTRAVTIYRGHPSYVLYDKGIFML